MNWVKVVFVIAILAVTIKASNQVNYDGYQVIRYEANASGFTTTLDMLFFSGVKYDIWHEKKIGNKVEFDVQLENDTAREKFERLFSETGNELTFKEYIHKDLGAEILHNMELNKQRAADPTFFTAYRTLDEINAFLNELVTQYPGFVKLINIGTSIENRSIYGVTITSPTGTTKPQIVYNSCQHAREWISPMTTTYIAYYLLDEYSTNTTIQSILDSFEYTIVPVVNVDGYEYTWTNDRLWRKNRREGDLCYGVDNNRNWGYEWGLNSGSSSQQCSETYRGTAEFSEPEETALANYISTLSNVVSYIDFHSYGYDFVWAWGYTSSIPPDNAEMSALASVFVDAVQQVHGSVFATGNSNTAIYPTSGSAPDWTYGAEGIVYSYTCELRGNSFIIPPAEINISGSEIFAGVVASALYLQNIL